MKFEFYGTSTQIWLYPASHMKKNQCLDPQTERRSDN